MADQTIAATEEMVGSGHATKSDTLNRHGLVEHGIDGTHVLANPLINTSQPCFNVHPAAQQANIVEGGEVTIIFGSEIFDVGNNFAANIFTAPITGKYLLSFCIRISELDQGATYYRVSIVTSNKTHACFTIDPSKMSADFAYWHFTGSIIIDMDITDTAYLTINQSGGANQTDIEAASYFSGSLIC